MFHTPPDGLGTYATEPHTQQSLIQAIVSYAPRRFRKSQGKLPSKISARALKESRRNFAPEFRLFPATLSYAPLLSGFASEAAEGRRRSETHPTLQRNRLSTLPDGVGTYAPRLSMLPFDMLSRGRDFIRKWGFIKSARQTSTQQTLNAARRCRNVRDRPSTPLLSGFASEAAEGRRRSETHPTLQRSALSTHPRGVRYVRTLCFNAPHFQRTPR